MTDSDCIFCKIVAGEIPSDIVHSDDAHIAFRDINPKADTHVLVIPRTHHADLDAFVGASSNSNALLAFVRDTAQKLDVAGKYRLITNVGADAGQDVFHIHFHILAGGRLPGFQ